MKRRDQAVNNEAIIASWQLSRRMQNGPGLPYETSKMTHFLSSVGISSLPWGAYWNIYEVHVQYDLCITQMAWCISIYIRKGEMTGDNK